MRLLTRIYGMLKLLKLYLKSFTTSQKDFQIKNPIVMLDLQFVLKCSIKLLRFYFKLNKN